MLISNVNHSVAKSNGYIRNLVYQNTSLLGAATSTSGNVYTGLCFPGSSFVETIFTSRWLDFPGKAFSLVGNPSFEIAQGSGWAGIILTDNDTSTSSV